MQRAFDGRNNHNTADIRHTLGTVFTVEHRLGGYSRWMYVRATAGITAGLMVIMETAEETVTNITGFRNTGNRARGAYPYIEDTGETWTVNEHVGSFLYLAGNTGAGQWKRIRHNTATRVYFEAVRPEIGETDTLTTDPDTTTDIVIFNPFHVQTAADADQQCVMGQAVQAFTSTYYGYILVPHIPVLALVKSGGSITIGEYVVVTDDTAGQFGAASDADNETMSGIAIHAGAADQYSPFILCN